MKAANEIQLHDKTLSVIRKKAKAGCFMCKWTLKALGDRNELRDYPLDCADEADPLLPILAQKAHIKSEIGSK